LLTFSAFFLKESADFSSNRARVTLSSDIGGTRTTLSQPLLILTLGRQSQCADRDQTLSEAHAELCVRRASQSRAESSAQAHGRRITHVIIERLPCTTLVLIGSTSVPPRSFMLARMKDSLTRNRSSPSGMMKRRLPSDRTCDS